MLGRNWYDLIGMRRFGRSIVDVIAFGRAQSKVRLGMVKTPETLCVVVGTIGGIVAPSPMSIWAETSGHQPTALAAGGLCKCTCDFWLKTRIFVVQRLLDTHAACATRGQES